MKIFVSMLLAAAVSATPAYGAEIFGGVYKHAVSTPLSLEGGREQGVDIQLGYRGGPIFGSIALEPYVFGALNSAGDTSYVAVGLSRKFGHRFFVRPGIGLAIHNGSAQTYDRPDRIAFGSRVLFEPELGVGVRVSPRATVEASWIHMSHATLFSQQNPGIDNIGVRFGLAL